MKVESREEQGICVVTLNDDHLDAANANEFRSQIAPVLQADTRMVIDLAGLNFVDSSGLGAFLSCMRQLAAKGGGLCLCGLSPSVRTLFELVRMHRIFSIHNTLEDALRSFE